MTAPLGNTGRDSSATTASQSSEQNGPRGLAGTNNGDGNSSPQANGRPANAIDGDEHPELDAFVKGFYDGDKFTDVDSRVWV
ncbi:hypothetical protein BG015_007558 [Linnemannia schmuckeri]|uniref:Uncharacterized protein n=1 Tax=Linnemannia schmuckeri TaxID=64567 RepID=A0A9P5SB71_9FUNG|nr:hypothetical protein BG015_007558 [Linnemannia schmuckeri]